MNATNGQGTVLAIDAMGGDAGPKAVIDGAAYAVRKGLKSRFVFFGDQEQLEPLIASAQELAGAEIRHTDNVVAMTDKPMHVLRRGRDTSMWSAIGAVAAGEAQAVVSGGNTGALMAVARKQLGMIKGIDRPAITALWPTPRGRTVVLDVGANVEANEDQLVQFAIMGEAFFRSLTKVEKPSVGLLNVGAEDLKGHELIRTAARVLREADPEMDFKGFVEGNDISKGTVDVVVTDGFTGNVALKSAEGAARLLGQWMKETLTGTLNAKLGALMMAPGLRKLKDRIDPSSNNGGVFLGVNGVVVKSHGGSDARGVASAIKVASSLARRPFQNAIAETVKAVMDRREQLSEAVEEDQTIKAAVV
ncbi:phosphate acyltransferase PlsX [Hyphococcus flavus]|uniref:Phosphate acyltransferase n=1 Tax=Hyphococcus flavus TaxID=1866326 RepID=A0AAE9ZCW7_9PROT|nr:phosphate acyltransferase PlsX [Hyphococcus flavus]WDI30652.1 phosphate acyltransferase PlsX [Hyphococcus flavus]